MFHCQVWFRSSFSFAYIAGSTKSLFNFMAVSRSVWQCRKLVCLFFSLPFFCEHKIPRWPLNYESTGRRGMLGVLLGYVIAMVKTSWNGMNGGLHRSTWVNAPRILRSIKSLISIPYPRLTWFSPKKNGSSCPTLHRLISPTSFFPLFWRQYFLGESSHMACAILFASFFPNA